MKIQHKTAIVPVTKQGDKYIIEIALPLWNQIQILLLEGAITKDTTLEFTYKDIKK